MTATAYERILDRLHEQGKKINSAGTRAQCPSHDDPNKTLAIYKKPGRVKPVCFVGCDTLLDVLPAIGWTVHDLYDEQRWGRPDDSHDWIMELRGRQEARKTMDKVQLQVDNLLHMPDLGERLALAIARERPELYIWEREQLGGDHG
jgi:hypothetical protein